MRRVEPHRRNERGIALMVALFLILLLVVAASLSVGMLVERQRGLQREGRQVHLQSLLDSGAALALGRFNENRQWSGPESQGLDDGEIALEVWMESTTRRRVTLVARYHGAERQAVAIVEIPEDPAEPPRLLDWSYGPPGPVFEY